ncbi:MAG: AMP-binding protein [Rhodobacteraceae bacterium]|nr:AMP-binding protein [Paracoccaceae bacterium]
MIMIDEFQQMGAMPYLEPEATAIALKDGWYHTGNLAKMDPNGFLNITGRLKELIIRGGQNIAPAEVEETRRTAMSFGGFGVFTEKERPMHDPVHEETFHGHQIKIYHDDDTESPRDWSTFATMICWHRRYTLGDDHSFHEPRDFLCHLAECTGETELSYDRLMRLAETHAVILPLSEFSGYW